MRQQEDFRTPEDARSGLATPLFDEDSARTAAPVIPLDRVARRRSFAGRAALGDWRAPLRSPGFRRSWPLALLLSATLAAGVIGTNIYHGRDSAQSPTPATRDAAAEPEKTDDKIAAPEARAAAADASRGDSPARPARGERAPSGTAADGDDAETFAASSALGSFFGGVGDDGEEAGKQGRVEPGGENGKGKRHGRSKRRQKAKRGGGSSSGGARLFDVIRD